MYRVTTIQHPNPHLDVYIVYPHIGFLQANRRTLEIKSGLITHTGKVFTMKSMSLKQATIHGSLIQLMCGLIRSIQIPMSIEEGIMWVQACLDLHVNESITNTFADSIIIETLEDARVVLESTTYSRLSLRARIVEAQFVPPPIAPYDETILDMKFRERFAAQTNIPGLIAEIRTAYYYPDLHLNYPIRELYDLIKAGPRDLECITDNLGLIIHLDTLGTLIKLLERVLSSHRASVIRDIPPQNMVPDFDADYKAMYFVGRVPDDTPLNILIAEALGRKGPYPLRKSPDMPLKYQSYLPDMKLNPLHLISLGNSEVTTQYIQRKTLTSSDIEYLLKYTHLYSEEECAMFNGLMYRYTPSAPLTTFNRLFSLDIDTDAAITTCLETINIGDYRVLPLKNPLVLEVEKLDNLIGPYILKHYKVYIRIPLNVYTRYITFTAFEVLQAQNSTLIFTI